MTITATQSPWTRDGKSLSADMCEMEHAGFILQSGAKVLVKLDDGCLMRLNCFFIHTRDGDVTHWTAGINGDTYTIFND